MSTSDEDRLRIAIVDSNRCRPRRCNQECKKYCPVNKTGKHCISAAPSAKQAAIAENLCIGCGICVKRCPFNAIIIINLPKDLTKELSHRYSQNGFKLHRLPMPRPGTVLGLIGTNGIGKSTALKILSGKLKPNLGRYSEPPDWQEILKYWRGSSLQNYFTDLLEDKLKTTTKPQYVDMIPKQVKGTVGDMVARKDERGVADEFMKLLELDHLKDRDIADLSGGELQRFAICIVCVMNCQVYMFDEPSSYLDVRQRLKVAHLVRGMVLLPSLGNDEDHPQGDASKYVIVVEHDLSVLDYMSDQVSCLWGAAGVYGVVTTPASVRAGINMFLDGYVPTENLRFREVSLTFRVQDADDTVTVSRSGEIAYNAMTKSMGGFTLEVEAGAFNHSQTLVMVGENGTGKSTLIRMLAGFIKPDGVDPGFSMAVSMKPQTLAAKFDGTVRDLLNEKISDSIHQHAFQIEVMKPMLIDPLMDFTVKNLSGGELQRVALTLALGKTADLYLIDEPSAYLDVEQRIVAARVIKRFIYNCKKACFVVEHDFVMASYLADRIIVFDGTPGVKTRAMTPTSLLVGMNQFLKNLQVTFRRDPNNFRPRINKTNSQKDREQKLAGNYFLLDSA